MINPIERKRRALIAVLSRQHVENIADQYALHVIRGNHENGSDANAEMILLKTIGRYLDADTFDRRALAGVRHLQRNADGIQRKPIPRPRVQMKGD